MQDGVDLVHDCIQVSALDDEGREQTQDVRSCRERKNAAFHERLKIWRDLLFQFYTDQEAKSPYLANQWRLDSAETTKRICSELGGAGW